MILLVNTCCLIPNNSKWPLSSLFNFVCLTYVYFGYQEFFSKVFDLRTIYVIPNNILAKNILLKPTLYNKTEFLYPGWMWRFETWLEIAIYQHAAVRVHLLNLGVMKPIVLESRGVGRVKIGASMNVRMVFGVCRTVILYLITPSIRLSARLHSPHWVQVTISFQILETYGSCFQTWRGDMLIYMTWDLHVT